MQLSIMFYRLRQVAMGRGLNRFADRRIWLKRTTWISDFGDTFCGLVNFERSSDRGFLQHSSVDYEFFFFFFFQSADVRHFTSWCASIYFLPGLHLD